MTSGYKSNKEKTPPLSGLILIGGKSRRMGFPKEQIIWHDKQQRYHLADLLKPYCTEVFFSCRADQQAELTEAGYLTIQDCYRDIGPMGGILSALKTRPQQAWLVLACDLPFVDRQTLALLITQRNSNKMVTAFQSPIDGLPEPLIAIWEPPSYPHLYKMATAGNYALRQVFSNAAIQLLPPPHPLLLTNVNTVEEARQAIKGSGLPMTGPK